MANGRKTWIPALAALAAAACGQADRQAGQADPNAAAERAETTTAPQEAPVRVRANEPEGALLAARPASAPRAAPEAPARFSYLRYRIDVSGDAPEACLTFSSALDPQVDYSTYVRLAPEAPIALSATGSTLCVGGLTFGERRELTLLAGLPAADGRSLAADETTPIDFADRPAVVSFKGDGVILPRRDADGLAIETVNVDALRVRVWRINDRALAFKRVTAGFAAAEGSYDGLYGDESYRNVGELIWDGEMDVAATANAPVTTVFPIAEAIGRLEPGAYAVQAVDLADADDARRRPARAERWLVVTDLALTGYWGADGLDLVLRSLATARPVEGVELDLVAAGNEVLSTARTDAEGRARFSAAMMRGQDAVRPRLALAYGPEGDFALLDLDRPPVDLSGHDVGGRRPAEGADVFVYLDRGIYRPGETVRASALIRDGAAMAITDRPGAFVVRGPNGIEAARTRFDGAPDAGAVHLDYDVPTAAARGVWRLELELDGLGRIGAETFSVEDFVPQRIALSLTADADTPLRRNQRRPLQADVRFLYGAPGAGLPVDAEARIETDPNPFPTYPGYRFGRHDDEFGARIVDLPSAVADGAGQARLMLTPGDVGLDAHAPLSLRVVASAQEPGGRAVREAVRIPYRTRDVYLGLKRREDPAPSGSAPVAFDIVAIGPDGAPTTADLEWRLLAVNYQYDWWRTSGGEWRWRRSREVVEVETGAQALQGEGTIRAGVVDRGRYELVVTDTASGVQASAGFTAGWGRWRAPQSDAPDRVEVAAPETPPAVGDTVEIVIDAPYAGDAEVIVATDRVLAARQIQLGDDGATVRFPVTEEWGAGAYVLATVYTPRDPVERPIPRRAAGVAYVPVDMGPRTFALEMDAPELARPRATLPLTISATGPIDETAFVTLAAVDEGVLNLTKFASPDPTDWFFGKKRLGVDLRDDYGRLLDPNQGPAAPVRAGGDQIGGAGLTVVPTKTVALFTGPVAIEDGRAQIALELPDFNGELRLMAVAWSASGVGAASQPLTVRDPVPAELILPRFLAPGDESVLTATIDNIEGGAGEFSATVRADGPMSLADAGAFALPLASGERRDAPVPILAGGEGIAETTLAVSGPGGFAVSRSYPIQVRSPYLPMTVVERALVEPGDTYAPSADLLAAFTPGSGSVQVSFAAIPMDAAALYDSLSRYPYGCTEQVVSRAMPLVYADEIAALAARADDPDTRYRVQEAVTTVLNRQTADGAIGLWRIGDRNASPWLGAYTVDFLARAKVEGYGVPDAALDRAYDVLDSVLEADFWRVSGYDLSPPWTPDVVDTGWSPDTRERRNARARAYAGYVLARAGRADPARLRYIHDEQLEAIESPLARAHIATALAFVGDRARSTSAFASALQALGYVNDGDYYQTPRRDLAGVLALAAEAGHADLMTELAERVADDLPEPARLTTQEKAFLLLAAHALSGGEEVRIQARGAGANAEGPAYGLDDAALAASPAFTNQGAAPVWRTTLARGAPVAPPPTAAEGVAVSKAVRRADGSPAPLNGLAQGDRVVVEITLSPRQRRLMPMIVADLLPAGLEIDAILTPDDAGGAGPYAWLGELAQPDIAEARDDRFVAAIDLRGEPVTLAYIARAVTPGRYAAPGAVAEDMYRPDVFARSEPYTVTIAPRS